MMDLGVFAEASITSTAPLTIALDTDPGTNLPARACSTASLSVTQRVLAFQVADRTYFLVPG